MEQHPIPQQISSYQFKLVGDMTLKQFFQVAGGALIGLLFYSTNLHPIIKWPIILVSTLIGVALAFLPFEERPLEKWIISFFRSIYSPTWFAWKKGDNRPENFFTETPLTPTPVINTGATPADYLQSTPQTSAVEHKKLEEAEKSFLGKITSMSSVASQAAPAAQPITSAQPIPTTPLSNVANTPAVQPTNTTDIKPAQTTPSFSVPQQTPIIIPKTAPKLVVEERPAAPMLGTEIKAENITTSPMVSSKTLTSKEAEFSIDAAPPNPPTIPNTVVGQVIDQDRKIISGAILEIRDTSNRPVRALKSNLAGHFIIVTPLLNGKYEISTEKDGYAFEPISFTTDGSIIPPIAIKGTQVQV